MSGKKSDEKKEKKENQKPEQEGTVGIKIKETGPQPGPGFKVSEEEEIEYLNQEEEERTASCKVESGGADSGAKKEETEKIIQELKKELELKEKENADLKNQIEELKDKFLRSVAELENVRKRIEKDKEEFYQYALSDLLKEILTIIDNFERALKTSEEETDGKTFREGVELIYRMLLNLLRKHGVRPIELGDKKFDPALHHALSSEESEEVSEPEIKEELQKGYLIHNRLLRPTMVKVVIPKKN